MTKAPVESGEIPFSMSKLLQCDRVSERKKVRSLWRLLEQFLIHHTSPSFSHHEDLTHDLRFELRPFGLARVAWVGGRRALRRPDSHTPTAPARCLLLRSATCHARRPDSSCSSASTRRPLQPEERSRSSPRRVVSRDVR